MVRPSLSDLTRPDRTALVLQELQNGVVAGETILPDLADAAAEVGVVPNASRLATAARTAGVPVIHATAASLPGGFGANRNARLFAAVRRLGVGPAPGTSSATPVRAVYADDDLILPRYHGLSPMTGTQLDPLLRNAGITTVVIAGVSLNVAIPNTVFDAVNHSYQVVIASDAVAGTPVEYGRQVLRHSLGLIATITTTADLIAAWKG
ncbi:MAG TPA: cysteine hydrolase [Trebonia sp.]|nr:cysteine hydrolase [Trebonia sp.]